MQFWIKNICLLSMITAVIAGFPALSSAQFSAPQGAGPVEVYKFRLPDYDSQGVLKSEMFGDKAVVEGNIITIHNLRVEMYDAGNLFTSFWAEKCVYNKAKGTLFSDTPVRVVRSGMMMTGKGMEWKKGDSVVVIRDDVRVLTIGGAEWFKVERKK